jgi:hypothetical protein
LNFCNRLRIIRIEAVFFQPTSRILPANLSLSSRRPHYPTSTGPRVLFQPTSRYFQPTSRFRSNQPHTLRLARWSPYAFCILTGAVVNYLRQKLPVREGQDRHYGRISNQPLASFPANLSMARRGVQVWISNQPLYRMPSGRSALRTRLHWDLNKRIENDEFGGRGHKIHPSFPTNLSLLLSVDVREVLTFLPTNLSNAGVRYPSLRSVRLVGNVRSCHARIRRP